jgi:hypothetical protein
MDGKGWYRIEGKNFINAFDFGADGLPHFMLTVNAMLGMGSYGGRHSVLKSKLVKPEPIASYRIGLNRSPSNRMAIP